MTRLTGNSGGVEIPDELLSGRLQILECHPLAMMFKRPPGCEPNHLNDSARHATCELEHVLDCDLAVRDRTGIEFPPCQYEVRHLPGVI
jgi:hypothetical protein